MSKLKKNKATEYAVKYLFDIKKVDIKNIAIELKLSENEVEKILGNNSIESEALKTSVKAPSKSKNLMISHTSTKKTNSVSIMTEAASQLNDDLKKKLNNSASRNTKNCIFRPNQ
jgi:hypothetical protein